AEAEIAADFRQPDAAEQLARGRPAGGAAVAQVAAGIARAPDVAQHVAAHAVGPTLDVVDHEVGEALAVAHLVVGADIEHEHVVLAAGAGVARPLAGADDVELLV